MSTGAAVRPLWLGLVVVLTIGVLLGLGVATRPLHSRCTTDPFEAHPFPVITRDQGSGPDIPVHITDSTQPV
jgi:hypothetical protein